MTAHAGEAVPPRRGPLLALLVVAQTLGIANAGLIVVALPELSAELNASSAEQQWVVDAYVLVLAAGLILAGALADRWGPRRLLLAGLSTFAVTSVLCALTQSPALLIGLRALQALGPAVILPASLTILAATFPQGPQRARAYGIWGGASGLGVALGPLVGGVIVTWFGWRWAFAFNAPIVLVLLGLAVPLLQKERRVRPRHRLDWLGAVLVTGAMAALVFSIIQAPHDGWQSARVGGMAALAAMLLAAFFLVERRHPRPLVDLSLLAHRPMLASNIAAAAVVFAELGAAVCLSAYLQRHGGASPLEAGVRLLPIGVGIALLAIAGGRLAQRMPTQRQLMIGLGLCLLGVLLLSRSVQDTDPDMLVPGLFALGAGVGFALPAGTAAAANAPSARTGMAGAIHNAARQLGGTLGVAVMGSIVVAQGAAGTAAAHADALGSAMLAAATCLGLAITGLLVLTRRAGARTCAA